jgi:hypothetical protein
MTIPDTTVSELDECFHVENGRLAPLTMRRALERCGPRHQETTMPKYLLLKRSRKD